MLIFTFCLSIKQGRKERKTRDDEKKWRKRFQESNKMIVPMSLKSKKNSIKISHLVYQFRFEKNV